jgi:micrococcal nuclease
MTALIIVLVITAWTVYRISLWDKPPKGKHERVKLIRVIDGDTYEFKRRSGEVLKIRLRGCDTPELSSGDKKAVQAKNAVIELFTDCEIDLYDVKIAGDKYGRTLASVFAGGVDVAKYLINHGLAVEYYGGKKNNDVKK